MSRRRLVALAALLVSCSNVENARRAPADATVTVASDDSLVVSAPGGVEIWFTLPRRSRLADGSECVDHAIQLRHGGRRTPVPLLYTGVAPRIVNDTIARAILYTNCRPGDSYFVDLRSGRPTREHR